MNATATIADIKADIADCHLAIAQAMETGADCTAERAALEELCTDLAVAEKAATPVKAVRQSAGRYLLVAGGKTVGSAYKRAIKGAMTVWSATLNNGKTAGLPTLKGITSWAQNAI